jgi:hypothetical protein
MICQDDVLGLKCSQTGLDMLFLRDKRGKARETDKLHFISSRILLVSISRGDIGIIFTEEGVVSKRWNGKGETVCDSSVCIHAGRRMMI